MIYLDNAATTFPKPEEVSEVLEAFARQAIGNPGRGSHRLAIAAERMIADCRHLVCRLLGAGDPARIVFTLNGTDSLNAAIKGVLRPGDHVVTGILEHNSVLRPLAGLQQNGLVTLSSIPCDSEGFYRPEDVSAALRPNTRLVVLTHASNVLGTVQPIEAIGPLCKAHGALFLVDAAQTAGTCPIDVCEQNIDLLAAPGHKSLFGPTGTGILYVGPRVELRAWREGGTGGSSLLEGHPTDFPEALEGGTPNVLGIAALAAGVDYVLSHGIENLRLRQCELAAELLEGLRSIPRIRVWGNSRYDHRLAIASFTHPGLGPEDLAAVLDDSFSIAVRAGLHCAPGVHKRFQTSPDGTVRASASCLQPQREIAQLIDALRAIDANL